MGSRSDWETMRHAAETLDELGVAYERRVVSAHRTPDLLFEYAGSAEERGLPVGRPARRVRSRGLPRNRRMEQKWGIMTEAIRQSLHGQWGW